MFQETSSESKFRKKSANEAIRLIDLQIANLHESIRILNSQRNGHLPISKLPVEILTKIFLLHQHNVTLQTLRLDWVGITHVSQRWREIALNFSGLWIRIPFHQPKWAKEMIARSQHACPIVNVYIPSLCPSEARLLKSFLQQHLSRVQVLEIWDTNPHLLAKLFQDIQPTCVPCLSTLSLSMSVQWQEPGTELDSLQIVNSRLLNTNSLRKLNISTTPRWDLNLFSGLTHLKLRAGHNMPRTQTSQHEFLDALRRMPNLQSLHLDGPALPEAVDKSSLEPVHLPDLRDLTVRDTVPTIEFFLHHVTLPPTTRTAIGCRHRDPVLQLANISPIISLLKRLLSERPRGLKLHHIELSLEETADWELKFEGWVSAGCSPLKGYDPNSAADFTFFVEWDSDQADTLSPIDELSVGMFGIFPPDDVVSLLLSSYDDTCFRHFARKIGRLPALHTLSLSYISSAPFLQELDCDAPQERDDQSIPTYPALRVLDFSDHEIQIDVPGLTTLYNCLKKRSEVGLGPEKLKIDLCVLRKVDKKTTALLEKVVEVESEVNDCQNS